MTFDKITSEVLKLGWRERLDLIQVVLKSIAYEKEAENFMAENNGLTVEQAKEIDRRMEEFRAGKVETIPGDVALAEIAEKYGLQL